jgi:hypothetical protein
VASNEWTPLTDDSFENQLPDDLKPVADALRQSRAVADGHLLERVLHRVNAGSPPPRRWRLLTPRTAVTTMLALAVLVGARVSHFNVVHGMAVLAGSVTNTGSTSPGGSAANLTYCPEGPGGWAPTFRWHYGAPTPDTQGYDDGWSPSVQPDCTDGSLKINLVDQVTVPATNLTFWSGFDFHTANKPQYTMTASHPTVTLNLACASGKPTPSTWTVTWGGNTYQSQANTWVPDNNNKTALVGFQSGSFTLPAACGANKSVIVTGGTFFASITTS